MANATKWDAITTHTANNYMPTMVDCVFSSSPFMDWMKRKGVIKLIDGGLKIIQPLMVGGNDNFTTFTGYDNINIKPFDGVTAAEFEWCQWATGLSLCSLEELQNNGAAAMLSLIQTKIKQTERSTARALNAMFLLSDGTNSGAEVYARGFDAEGGKRKDYVRWGSDGRQCFAGLPLVVSDTLPFGGIDPTKPGCEFWRSLVWDFSDRDGEDGDPNPGNGLGVIGYEEISEAISCLSDNGMFGPDLILSDEKTWRAYKNQLEKRRLITGDGNVSRQGFAKLYVDEVEWMYDRMIPEGTIYLLNSAHLQLRPHSQEWFKQHPWNGPYNQRARYQLITGAGQLTTDCRDKLGVLCNVEIGDECFPVEVCNADEIGAAAA